MNIEQAAEIYLKDWQYKDMIHFLAYTISPQVCTAYGGDKRAVVQNDTKQAVLWEYDT